MHVLIDALVLALSYVLSWYCYVRLGVMNNHPERGILPPATYMMALLYIVPGYLLLYYAFNLYASKRNKSDPLYLKQYVETRPQPEADSDGRLQPCDRGIY